uniref:Uncharacterized protein n=1 Tax=Erythrolobus madagascarensis TaxID=708628 RepID=A0A7S0T6Q0_9RHOD|mmetsp:Transcript_4544/g.9780  ORF Transcript_4544/g.9780 Transcript_4544/m.9780 type:complete len:142 (+) Transcript_4544:1-426(+)
MTYVGVLQRDASALDLPPSSNPTSKDPAACADPRDRALREHSIKLANSYSNDIVTSSHRIASLIDRVHHEIESTVGSEATLIRKADEDAALATQELEDAVKNASSMLYDLRAAIDHLDLPAPHLQPPPQQKLPKSSVFAPQ